MILQSPIVVPDGTTEGVYDLRLSFNPTERSDSIIDTTGNVLDGDGDGLAGGSLFWFNVNQPADVAGVGRVSHDLC